MNSIHPTALIDGDVTLGSGNTIGPYVVITGPVTIGDGNWFGSGTVVGAPPEVRSWQHPTDAAERSSGNGVVIGDRNVFREHVQIHQGWKDRTRIGDDAFIMNQCYLAHDSVVEDGATLASSVLLAGHVRVGAGANLGLGVVRAPVPLDRCRRHGGHVGGRDARRPAVRQGVRRSRADVRGANVVGMQRAGVDPDVIRLLSAIYAGEAADVAAIPDGDLRAAVGEWLAGRLAQGDRA